ncbi:MAG: Pyridoxamine 5-phosphate oxidase [Solirubrobacterales bacterium]|nr:Pyridoxamine 5-phosphate oxidase [Solirubrobacterales bacterium]
MSRVYDEISETQRAWIAEQAMFFVGTAPLHAEGHVNVSPKGPIGSLAVLGPHEVAYLDIVGSGAETIAHVRENGRIVVMLCAFHGPPRILRLHGTGEVLLPQDARYAATLALADFDEPSVPEARRAIVRIDVQRIADACGYGVPLMQQTGERQHAVRWADKKLRTGGTAAIDTYVARKNRTSIDGLPALDA